MLMSNAPGKVNNLETGNNDYVQCHIDIKGMSFNS